LYRTFHDSSLLIFHIILLSTYEIWKVLVSLAFFFIANFYVLGLFIPKKLVLSEKKIRLSRGVAGVAVGFWTKFEA
jgi:hypothetical protein